MNCYNSQTTEQRDPNLRINQVIGAWPLTGETGVDLQVMQRSHIHRDTKHRLAGADNHLLSGEMFSAGGVLIKMNEPWLRVMIGK